MISLFTYSSKSLCINCKFVKNR